MSWTQRLERSVAERTDADAARACAVIVVFAGLFVMYAGRHLSIFFYDEWSIVIKRQGGSLGTYLDPHGGHFILFIVVVYKLLFAIFGLRHYIVFRFVGVLMQLACATLLYLLARRRIGAWWALLPTTMLLFMGTAGEDLLWPFQIGFFASLAGALAALVLLERHTRRSDIGACIALAIGITGSGVGVAGLFAVAVYLAVAADRKRWWVVGVPTALFLLWYFTYGSSETVTSQQLLAAPGYMASAAGAALAGIAGVDLVAWAPALLLALIVLVVLTVARAPNRATPLLFAGITGAVMFWLLTAIVRGDIGVPDASRYLYVGAVFIWIVIAELFRAWGAQARPAAVVLVLGLALAAIVSNVGTLRGTFVTDWNSNDVIVSAALATTEVAGPAAIPTFEPSPSLAPDITAGPYLHIIRTLGSPAITEAQLAASPPQITTASDLLLEQMEGLALGPYQGSLTGTQAPEMVSSAHERPVSAPPGCVRFIPDAAAASVTLTVAPGHQLLVKGSAAGGVSVALWRFAGGFANPALGSSAAAAPSQLTLPRDAQPSLPWHVLLAAAGSLEACVH
jgi:hypothetical protein